MKQLLVLSPVSEPAWVEASTEVTADCGHQSWLSPGSKDIFASEDFASMCSSCFGGKAAMAEAILAGEAKSANPQELTEQFLKWKEQN